MKFKIEGREYTLRKATMDDFRYYCILVKRTMYPYMKTIGVPWRTDKFKEQFFDNHNWILQRNNRRIGLLALYKDKQHTHISDVQLTAQYRSKGIGSKLISFSEQQAKKWKHSAITLSTFKINTGAKKLYHKLGYKPFKTSYNGKLIRMKKKI